MEKENVIVANNIKKNFKVYLDRGKTIKERIIMRGRGKYEEREVLKGISFSVKKGEAVGLIGKNGCGKSTTLKLLTKIIYPDSGDIQIKGKVSSLLELGAGFHPDMSGRENIYLNASIFGLTKKEIDEKISDIISFSELEEFIENPVRTYSSGMYMRLAFSVAINVNAEVLLIDEILGVGDVSFQKKCFERLQEIKAAGTTIVIVSHSLEQLERICDRCIWIQDGKIKEDGIPLVVNAHYYKTMEELRLDKCKQDEIEKKEVEKNVTYDTEINELEEQDVTTLPDKKNTSHSVERIVNDIPSDFMDKNSTRVGTYEAFFSDLFLKDKNGNEEIIYSMDKDILIYIKIKSNINISDINVSVSVTRDDGVYCYGTNTKFDKLPSIQLDGEEKEIQFIFKNIQLLPGKYFINLGLYDQNYKEYDVIWSAKMFYVKTDNPSKELGVYKMEHDWIY